MSILQVITCYDVKVLLDVAIIGIIACAISGIVIYILHDDYNTPATVIKMIFLFVFVIGFILIAFKVAVATTYHTSQLDIPTIVFLHNLQL